MIIAIDKNQCIGSHKKSNEKKHKQMIKLGHELITVPLPFGDYCMVTDEMSEIINSKGSKLAKKDLIDSINISIDTKKNIEELWGNVHGKQHDRFRRELIKPIEHNSKLIILIEHGDGIDSLEDVMFFYQPAQERYRYKTVTHQGKALKIREKYMQQPIYGDRLYKSMLTMRDRYNVQFEFCDKRQTGQRIIDLLKTEGE